MRRSQRRTGGKPPHTPCGGRGKRNSKARLVLACVAVAACFVLVDVLLEVVFEFWGAGGADPPGLHPGTPAAGAPAVEAQGPVFREELVELLPQFSFVSLRAVGVPRQLRDEQSPIAKLRVMTPVSHVRKRPYQQVASPYEDEQRGNRRV